MFFPLVIEHDNGKSTTNEVSMGIAKFENRRVNDVGVCTLFSDKSI